MSRDVPDHVPLEKATQAGRLIVGELAVKRLPRLQGVVAQQRSDEEKLKVTLQFGRDEEKRPVVEVGVTGAVMLTCQRTLQPFLCRLESLSTVALVTSEHEAESLPEGLEPVLCEQGQVGIIELVEEEVLLALPLRPVSPESAPIQAVSETAAAHDRQRPFAEVEALEALAEQLKRKAGVSDS